MYKAGWLQRDISDGNVLMTKPTVNASNYSGQKFGQKTMTGFVTDGDQAIKWKEPREGVQCGSVCPLALFVFSLSYLGS